MNPQRDFRSQMARVIVSQSSVAPTTRGVASHAVDGAEPELLVLEAAPLDDDAPPAVGVGGHAANVATTGTMSIQPVPRVTSGPRGHDGPSVGAATPQQGLRATHSRFRRSSPWE